MAGSYINLPLGMGGLVNPPFVRELGTRLPPAMCAAPPDPIGLAHTRRAGARPRREADAASGGTRHTQSVGAGIWTASFSKERSDTHPALPRSVTVTIGAAQFLLEGDAVHGLAAEAANAPAQGAAGPGLSHELTHVVQQSPAEARWIIEALLRDAADQRSPASAFQQDDESQSISLDIESAAAALEKLAVRLPSKPRRLHAAIMVDEWELDVSTDQIPWRVTRMQRRF